MSWTQLAWFSIGFMIGLLVSYRQIRTIHQEAQTDTLTGLYNRSLLEKTLGRLLAAAKRNKKSLSILMIDLNHFKEANDRFGHQFGDEVLKAASQAMVASLRASDFIFRYGGDEFFVVLPDTSSTGANRVAKKIMSKLTAIQLTTPKGTQFEDVGASIGVSTYPEHAEVDTVLIKAADDAVYVAKDRRDHIKVAG